MTEYDEQHDPDPGLPGLARVAAYAALHTTEWGVRASLQSWKRVGRAVTDPEEAAALVEDAGRATGAHVDARLGTSGEQQHQDPGLVGRELTQDPLEGGVALVGVPHVA